MNIKLTKVNIGEEIKKRFDDTEMSKSEFGRRIGVPQQHVNRIFERDTIETKKLESISEALDFNFFSLYCELPSNVFAYLAAIAMGDGDAINLIGDAALVAQMEVMKAKIEGLEKERDALADQIETLKGNLRDKEEIINLVKGNNKQ